MIIPVEGILVTHFQEIRNQLLAASSQRHGLCSSEFYQFPPSPNRDVVVRAAGRRLPTILVPRALEAASAAFVRALIIRRSPGPSKLHCVAGRHLLTDK